MSEPLRVALVAEGPTDGIVIEAALRAVLGERPFVLKQIFPEGSTSFGELGTGWVGVYRWRHQSARRGKGKLSGDALVFQHYDALILHLDADVAGCRYADGSITPEPSDRALPCEHPCPPPQTTTNALRDVLLSWCGETSAPAHTVICTPSKSTEAWVLAMLFREDRAVRQGIECFADPEARLSQQPVSKRLRKRRRDYVEHADQFTVEWPRIAEAAALSQAHRFATEILHVLQAG